MGNKNTHDLSRYIPKEIAHEIRRRSKFGCVKCRSVVYQYEHIDPEFSEAKEHDPNNMCLLCGACHDKVTRGRLSKDVIKKYYDYVQSTDDVRPPFEELDFSTNNLSIILGGATFEHSSVLIKVNGEDLLSITSSDNSLKIPSLSGVFCDIDGRVIFRIKDNVWEGLLEAWDIEVVNNRVTIKMAKDRIALSFELRHPNIVYVKELNMYKDGCHLICKNEKLYVGQLFNGRYVYIGFGGFVCRGSLVGISVDATADTCPSLSGIVMTGGGGICLDGTGIKICDGGGQMIINQLQLFSN